MSSPSGSSKDVLYLQATPRWTSMMTVHAELIEGLARRGVRVHIASPPPDDDKAGVVQRMKARGHRDFFVSDLLPALGAGSRRDRMMNVARVPFNLAAYVAYVRAHRVRLVHVPTHSRSIVQGMLLARTCRIPLVVHQHMFYAPWYSRAMQWCFRHADAVVAVSAPALQTAIDAGVSPARGHVVENTVDVAKWHPRRDRATVRRELNVPDGAFLIGMVGRMVEQKGQLRIIRALGKIKDAAPNAMALLVGGPDFTYPGSNEYLAECQRVAQELGIFERVIFAGNRDDVPDLLGAMDVFGMAARHEAFGLVYLEAMASGLPVVAERSGGTSVVCVEDETALLTAPDDVDALGRALLTLFSNAELRAQMGARGRKRAVERFSPDAASDAMMRVIESVS